MAKKELAVRVPSEPLAALEALFQEQGLVEWSIKSKLGQKTVFGRTRNGGAVRYSVYATEGFHERSISQCAPLSRAKRRIEAKRLSNQGHTQMEIAERLGCSQKTVSNDLAR